MHMSVSTSREGYHALIKLNGEFDALGCRDIRADLERLIHNFPGGHLGIDLSDVSFIDSSGVGAIVFLYKRLLASSGQVSLIGVRNQPKELLKLLRVDEAIPTQWND